MGLLAPESLQEHVRGQVTEIVYSLFHWRRGTIDFRDGVPPEERIALSGTVMNLIMEGTRRLDEWSRVRQKIQSESIVLAPVKTAGEIDASVALSGTERRVLALVNGRRTVRKIVERSGAGEFQTWLALYALLSAGAIRIQLLAFDPPAPAAPEQPAPAPIEALEGCLDRYSEAVALILDRAAKVRGPGEVARLRRRLRQAAFERADLLRETAIDPDGRIDRRVLLANIADDPPQQWEANLRGALDSLMEFLGGELQGKVDIEDVLAALQSR
jgi:hypothetical protein